MTLTVLVVAAIGILNLFASRAVLGTVEVARTQRLIQVAFVWCVPIVGAIVCLMFVSSLSHVAVKASAGDSGLMPLESQTAEGVEIGICGCGGGDGGGD